jgi:hypothetical protein
MKARKKSCAAKPKSKAASEGIAPAVFTDNAPRPKPEGYVFGRPSSYSIEIAEEICKRLVTRDENGKTRCLKHICDMDDMPIERTVYNWLLSHKDFFQLYARAKETLADMNAEDILDIADNAKDANLARLQIDARKWWASKVAPKRYGDKIGVSGDGDGAPIQHQVGISWMTESQAKARGWE